MSSKHENAAISKTTHRRNHWQAFNGQCEHCGDYLYYEAPHKETFDQPASKGGYYCDVCDEWTD